MGTVDAALLGRYDDSALAAAGVGNSVLFAVVSVGLGVVMGLDTVLPQAVGAQRTAAAGRSLAAGLRLAMLIGLGCTVVALAAPALLSVVGLAISLALAFGAGLGAPGLWWGLSAGLTATALYLVQRFLAGTREPRGRTDLPGATAG
jgi:Na+-driven multidrug efflux pump